MWRSGESLLLMLVLVVLGKSAPLFLPFISGHGLAMACMAFMVLVSLLIGYVLAGPNLEDRTTVPFVISMRNPGLALLFAQIHAPSMQGLKLSILMYVLITVILSVPFLRWRKQLSEVLN